MKFKKKSMENKLIREGILVLLDSAISLISFIVAFCLTQFNVMSLPSYNAGMLLDVFYVMLIATGISTIIFVICGVYRVVWRRARTLDFLRLIASVVISCLIIGLIDGFGTRFVAKSIAQIIGNNNFQSITTYPTYIVYGAIMLLFTCGFRVLYKIVVRKRYSTTIKYNDIQKKNEKRTLIIGAGNAGNIVLEEMQRYTTNYVAVGILDDDTALNQRLISGVKVLGEIKNIDRVCQEYNVDVIIFAIPSIDIDRRTEILNECSKTGCVVKIVPGVNELIEGTSFIGQMRDVDVADLLGRPQITFEGKGVKEYVENKTIMITGGGGSIGSEICRQLVKYNPKRIVIVEVYENCAYNIQQEILRSYAGKLDFLVEILSVTDYDKLEDIYQQYHPEIVFHAAAHKHVPLMETNPEEAVKNNIFGTYNTILLADKYEVEKFILISTDKAVNPTNVMGATKRCCEKILQMISRTGTKTKFAAVRFGNVLGSNGSVIPLFKQQIEKGGPVTVTHKDIIRYFMTIPEAVSLVLQAGVYASDGEIFVLDMGKQVKIVTLAENLIKAMGYVPYQDIDIQFTGLRPGEKLYEELLMNEEGLQTTDNKKIFIGHKSEFDDKKFKDDLETMRELCMTNDKKRIVDMLKILVTTFKHDETQFNKMCEHYESIRLEFTLKNKQKQSDNVNCDNI